jgi:hypothetical protein
MLVGFAASNRTLRQAPQILYKPDMEMVSVLKKPYFLGSVILKQQ